MVLEFQETANICISCTSLVWIHLTSLRHQYADPAEPGGWGEGALAPLLFCKEVIFFN